LLVLGFKLADAMLFSGRRFADVGAASYRRMAFSPSFMSPQISPKLKPYTRIICTTCSLNSALNERKHGPTSFLLPRFASGDS